MENLSFEESPRGSRPRNPMGNLPGPSKPRADPSDESKDRKYENLPPLAHISDDEDDESPPAHVQQYVPQKKNIQEPNPHPDHQIGQQGANADNPEQQGANADNPEQQGANADNPEQQGANAGQQADVAADSGEQGAAESDPGQQAGNAPVRAISWREIYVSFCETIHSFNFQFCFHTVLLVWPILTAAMGILNAGQQYCKMNTYLPIVMVVMASFATMTIVNRLCAIYYERNFPNSSITSWWISVRVMELITWIGFCIELGLFFMQIPSYNPKETPYCMPKIYRINCVLIFLTSTLMIGWIVVNVRKLIDWLKIVVRTRNENRIA